MLLIDSDGVLVDWEGYVIKNHFPSSDMSEINEMDSSERHLRLLAMYNRDPNLFAKLHPLDGARQLIDYIKSTSISWAVLSAAGVDHPSYETVRKDKIRNLSGLFGIPENKIIVTRTSKDKIKYAAPNRTLVDDYARNCEEFESAGGCSIHVTAKGLLSGEVLKSVHQVVKIMSDGKYRVLL